MSEKQENQEIMVVKPIIKPITKEDIKKIVEE